MNNKKVRQLKKLALEIKEKNPNKDYKKIYKQVKRDYKQGIFKV